MEESNQAWAEQGLCQQWDEERDLEEMMRDLEGQYRTILKALRTCEGVPDNAVRLLAYGLAIDCNVIFEDDPPHP
jgi:hypothetical protein